MSLTRLTDKQVTFNNGSTGSIAREVGDKKWEILAGNGTFAYEA